MPNSHQNLKIYKTITTNIKHYDNSATLPPQHLPTNPIQVQTCRPFVIRIRNRGKRSIFPTKIRHSKNLTPFRFILSQAVQHSYIFIIHPNNHIEINKIGRRIKRPRTTIQLIPSFPRSTAHPLIRQGTGMPTVQTCRINQKLFFLSRTPHPGFHNCFSSWGTTNISQTHK